MTFISVHLKTNFKYLINWGHVLYMPIFSRKKIQGVSQQMDKALKDDRSHPDKQSLSKNAGMEIKHKFALGHRRRLSYRNQKHTKNDKVTTACRKKGSAFNHRASELFPFGVWQFQYISVKGIIFLPRLIVAHSDQRLLCVN